MKDYSKIIETRKKEKAEQLQGIDTEIAKINVAIDKEGGAASHALSSGDQGAFAVARAQVDYLKGRRDLLQKERERIATAPVMDPKEGRAAILEIDREVKADREALAREAVQEIDSVIDGLQTKLEQLQAKNAAVEKIAEESGADPVNVARGSEAVYHVLTMIAGSRELYLLREWLRTF
jgi:hypothetical protein